MVVSKVSVALAGIGIGMVMVSTFGRSQSAAIIIGYNDDIDTYLSISGNNIPDFQVTIYQTFRKQ